MDIAGLGWCGTRSSRATELAYFYEHILGLRQVQAGADFCVFQLPGGGHAGIFRSTYPGKEHFTTGPVAGFAVEDLSAAVAEFTRAGIERV